MTEKESDSGAAAESDRLSRIAKEVEDALETYGLTDYEQLSVLEAVKFSVLMVGWKKAERLYQQSKMSHMPARA